MRRTLGIALVLTLSLWPAANAAADDPYSTATSKKSKKSKFDANRYKFRNVNITITVANPSTMLGRAERLVVKHGGEIQNSSSNANNANLNVRLRPNQMNTVVSALRSFPGDVSNFSSHQSDYSSSARQQYTRMKRLNHADKAIVEALKHSPSDDLVDGLALLRELTQRERQNVENQLQSYKQQSEKEQLNISFNKPQ